MNKSVVLLCRCLLLTACMYIPLTMAAAVDGLYEASVVVEDRSQEEQRRGFGAAMNIVLVKLTGNRAVGQDPDLGPLLDNAAAFVQRFGYDADGLLRVGFDGAAIEQQLIGLGKSLWGHERPLTLVWLAMDDGQGNRRLIGANDNDAAVIAMQKAAATRGIPLLFPLLDAQDSADIAFIDVWGGFDEKLRMASARYGADAILVGRVRRVPASGAGSGQTADQYWARWILLYQSQTEHWRGNLSAGVDRTTDYYASLFAASTEFAGQLALVMVDGVDDFQSYARVSRYLEGLSAVSGVSVDRVENDRVYYRIALRTDINGLQRAIGLGQTLEQPGFDERDEDFPPVAGLHYRLRQ